MRTTRVSRHISAPRTIIYGLLIDPAAVERWRVPDGMRAQVHTFEAREGGDIHVSLEDNETGWRMAFEKLAAIAEGR